jgi:hypothetical protein
VGKVSALFLLPARTLWRMRTRKTYQAQASQRLCGRWRPKRSSMAVAGAMSLCRLV